MQIQASSTTQITLFDHGRSYVDHSLPVENDTDLRFTENVMIVFHQKFREIASQLPVKDLAGLVCVCASFKDFLEIDSFLSTKVTRAATLFFVVKKIYVEAGEYEKYFSDDRKYEKHIEQIIHSAREALKNGTDLNSITDVLQVAKNMASLMSPYGSKNLFKEIVKVEINFDISRAKETLSKINVEMSQYPEALLAVIEREVYQNLDAGQQDLKILEKLSQTDVYAKFMFKNALHAFIQAEAQIYPEIAEKRILELPEFYKLPVSILARIKVELVKRICTNSSKFA